jgi:hypothetical protein
MSLFQNEKLITRIRKSYIKVNDHWIVDKHTNGYGKIFAEGKNWGAHQLSYEVFVGPIPKGLYLDHLCRITNCINPDHLEPVTPRENNLRGNSVSGVNARKTHCKRGHELSTENVRIDNGTRQCKPCNNIRAAKYRKLKKEVSFGLAFA